jgi:hypothetical protein
MQRRGFVLSILSAGVLGASGITPLIGALPAAERAPEPIVWSKVEVLPDPLNYGYIVRGAAECGGLLLTYMLAVEDLSQEVMAAAKEETMRTLRRHFVNRGIVPQ